MSHTQTTQTIYEAFGRGDVPGILAHLTGDVDWNNDRVASRECPWNGNFSGKANAAAFFQAVAELNILVFDPHTYIEQGDRVAVLLRIESVLRKNGRDLKND